MQRLQHGRPTDLIWSDPVYSSGGRRHFTGPFEELHQELLALPEAKRQWEEVYFENERARLFYDMDGDNLTRERAEDMLAELCRRTDECLEELFQLTGVKRWVLDSSTAEKQSRHVFFDVCFVTLRALRSFVRIVLDRCTLKTAGEVVCAVDKGKYFAGNLRLPLAHKRGKTAVLRPVEGGEAFVFAKCMVNVVGDEPTVDMPMEPKRQRVEGGAEESRITEEVVDRLTNWLVMRAPTKPSGCKVEGNLFYGFVKGLVCPNVRRPHKSNALKFSAYVGKGNVDAHFTCGDPDCDRATVYCEEYANRFTRLTRRAAYGPSASPTTRAGRCSGKKLVALSNTLPHPVPELQRLLARDLDEG